MTLDIYIKRAIICIQSLNSKIGGLEATELRTLSVNDYQMEKARESWSKVRPVALLCYSFRWRVCVSVCVHVCVPMHMCVHVIVYVCFSIPRYLGTAFSLISAVERLSTCVRACVCVCVCVGMCV